MSNITRIGRPFVPRAVEPPQSLGQVASAFLAHKAVRNASPDTLKAYQTDLEQFVGHLTQARVYYLQAITARDVDAFINYTLQRNGVAPRTAARKLSVIKSFLTWAVRQDLLASNVATNAEPIKFVAARVIAPEVDDLLQVIDAIPVNTPMGLRDRAFFYLAFYTAARSARSILRLNLYDVADAVNTITPTGRMIYTIKGGAIKEKQLDDVCLNYLRAWLAVRDAWAPKTERALFVSRAGRRPSRQALYQRFKVYGAAVGLPDIFPHMLRHRRGGQILDALGVRSAQEFLDHRSASTTLEVYGHHPAAHQAALVEQYCPLSSRIKK